VLVQKLAVAQEIGESVLQQLAVELTVVDRPCADLHYYIMYLLDLDVQILRVFGRQPQPALRFRLC
jgi:hypothetical protein